MSNRNELLAQILAATGSSFNPTTGISIERLVDGSSVAATQEPAGLGVANSVQIEFGPAENTGSDPVNLLADGIVNFNTSGLYRIKVALQFGRSGSAGTSELLFRVLVNGTQAGRSVAAKLSNSNEEQYFENDTWIYFPGGASITFEVMRDNAGNNSGGLFQYVPTVEGGNEWNTAPSASIRVDRWVETP